MRTRDRSRARGWDGTGGIAPAALLLHERIAAIIAAGPAGWHGNIYPLGASEALTLTGSAVDACADYLDGVPAVGTLDARPAYSATALGGTKPGCTFDGSADELITAAIARGSDASFVLITVCATSTAGVRNPACWGDNNTSGGPGFGIQTTQGATGTLESKVRTDARSTALSTTFNTDTPAVLTGTWDSSLTTSETAVRRNGTNIVASMTLDGNPALTTLVNPTFRIGSRAGVGFFAGAISYQVFLRGTGTIAAALTMVAAIESELATALSAGDFWT